MNTHSTHIVAQLRTRGLIAQISHEEELNQLLVLGCANKDGLLYSAYCGIDPTAPSLHVGNLASLLLLVRAQRAGLRPIILFGGATGLIGDPTGRTEMRPMNSAEQIASYIENFKRLTARYFRFDVPNSPLFVNNIDWIGPMSWIDFSRQVGRHFTVARLLSAEVNKTRYQEGGLTFMELGYQLLQSYDFLHLYQYHNCIIQFGGDDQWSNILGGADLIRRVKQGKAFAVTTPLLVGRDGKKFGKSAGNAIWLDPTMTSPYEFFQFFRNVDDADVENLFRVFTFYPLEDIVDCLQNSPINHVKETLAYEVTSLVHGEQEAQKARETAKSLFTGQSGDMLGAPQTIITHHDLGSGIDILNLLIRCHLVNSRKEGRTLITGGGLSWDGQKFTDVNHVLNLTDFDNAQHAFVLRKGKKDYHRIVLEGDRV